MEGLDFIDGYDPPPRLGGPYVTPPPGDYTYVPPTPTAPGEDAPPLPTTRINRIKNKGWNTWARSIATLDAGKCCRFTVKSGVEGAVLGVAPEGRDGQGVNFLSHMLACDVHGVHIRENASAIVTLKNTQLAASQLRIHRQLDGTFVYVATTATETLVYTSAQTFPTFIPLYIYGWLYVTGDRVLSAEFMGVDVQYGSV